MMEDTMTETAPKRRIQRETTKQSGNTSDERQRANYQYYLDNYDELVKLYDGKVLVLVDCKVADVCDNEDEAYYGGMKKYGLGNFLMHTCTHEYKTQAMSVAPRIRYSK